MRMWMRIAGHTGRGDWRMAEHIEQAIHWRLGLHPTDNLVTAGSFKQDLTWTAAGEGAEGM